MFYKVRNQTRWLNVMILSDCDALRSQRFNSFLLHLQFSCKNKHGDPMFSIKKIMVLNLCFRKL